MYQIFKLYGDVTFMVYRLPKAGRVYKTIYGPQGLSMALEGDFTCAAMASYQPHYELLLETDKVHEVIAFYVGKFEQQIAKLQEDFKCPTP